MVSVRLQQLLLLLHAIAICLPVQGLLQRNRLSHPPSTHTPHTLPGETSGQEQRAVTCKHNEVLPNAAE